MSNDKPIYTVSELLAECRISRSFFYGLVRDGKGPRLLKMGRRTFVRAEALQDWWRNLESDANQTEPEVF